MSPFPGWSIATISGVFDDILGEALKAEIVLADAHDSHLDATFVKKYCGERLALEKIPGIIEFKNNLVVASTGKKVKGQKEG